MNLGQMKLEVQRIADKACAIKGINKANGEIITPEDIIASVKEVLQCQVQ
jgi:2-oxoglutarate ferredoxin oxidoreductase subunit alpha